MPEIKLNSKLVKPIKRILEPYEARLGRLDSTVIAIVELRSVKRIDVSLEAETAPAVYLQIDGLEVATRDQEEFLRRAMQAMYQLRTARGTIDELTSTEDANRQLNLLGAQLVADGEG